MLDIFDQFSIWSVVDILVLSVVIYQGLLLIRGTRAAQMLSGVLIFVAVFHASTIVPITTFHWLMSKFYSSFIIILVIIFQDDLRFVLRSLGKKPLLRHRDVQSSTKVLDEVIRAAGLLASKRIGALIVMERKILLSRFVQSGIQLDARVSKELLVSIFHPSSPIHDGAVLIQGDRVAAAGCFLPLSQDDKISSQLGTRHRAGLGLSQETDSVVIIVSEETATIGLAIEGELYSRLDLAELKNRLKELFKETQGKNEAPIS